MGRLAVVRQGLAATAEQPALVNHLYFGECIYAENDLRRFPAGLILILSAFLLLAGVTTRSPAALSLSPTKHWVSLAPLT
jgi:hypothetical protein